jgi:hypothetical protein
MVERVVERGREPEPKESIYEYMYREWFAERKRYKMEGQVVIKGKDVGWEQGRQGLLKYYLHPLKQWEACGTPDWSVFIHRITKHSGKHRHQGGLGIFVLEGRGYTVVDGTRYDWEGGDLILLPVKPEGCEHQHFNLDPDKPSEWMAFIFAPFNAAMGNDLEQKSESPDWSGGGLDAKHVT